MITKDNDLLGTLIHDVAYLLRHEIDDRLRPHNLTRVKWLALGVIDDQGPITQSELASKLELGAASVGRLVDRLVERGFVRRGKDPEDRRSYKLTLTKTAETLVEDLEDIAVELRNETLDALSETEVKSMNAGLKKLKKRLKAKALAVSGAVFFTVQEALPAGQILAETGVIV